MSVPSPAGGDARARLRLDGECVSAFAAALGRCEAERVAGRIWAGAHTLWKPAPQEIANRLGWLHSPAAMRRELPRIRGFAEEVRRDGIRQVLLLGMGGSSLAPELFTATFGAASGHPRVEVLDSTEPAAVRAAAELCPPESTLYLVSTKSGGTVETLGEGGLVVTGNEEYARKIRMLRDWGQDRKYHHLMAGYNYRMEGMQGAILRLKLRYLEKWTEARRSHAARYRELLADTGLGLPSEAAGCRHVYHVYAVRTREREP